MECRVKEFRQELDGESGYSYQYMKRIVLCDQPPGFAIEYELRNTGTQKIDQTYYAHNFIKIDDRPIGPDYRFTFPRAMTPDRDINGIVSVAGNLVTFQRSLKTGESVYTQFREHDLPATANGVLVQNTKSLAGIRITGNAPMARYHFWATDQVACPEAFVMVRVAPGETFRWKDTYELIVKP